MTKDQRADGAHFLKATGWSDVIEPELEELLFMYEQASIQTQLGMENMLGDDPVKLAAMAFAIRQVLDNLRKYFKTGRVEKDAVKDAFTKK